LDQSCPEQDRKIVLQRLLPRVALAQASRTKENFLVVAYVADDVIYEKPSPYEIDGASQKALTEHSWFFCYLMPYPTCPKEQGD
jgi:hypothetical protein